MEWLKIRKLEYLEKEQTVLRNKKILNLCLRWHILRSYHFVAEVTLKLPNMNLSELSFLCLFKILNASSSVSSFILTYFRCPPPFFLRWKGGGVNFDYFPWRGESEKLKGGGIIVQGKVFLKGRAGTFPI